MKMKSLAFVISVLFVMGLSGNVFAVSDSTGEALTAGVDIVSASVQTSNQTLPDPPDTANLGIRMNTGSHLPAVILFDMDVDNDTATGGGSVITGIPTMTCRNLADEPQVCKVDVGGGFDFTIGVFLRTQDDTSSWSNCSGCSGGAVQCTTRSTAHDCGVDGTCYELGDSCDTGAGCYDSSNRCETGCPAVFAYPLNILCDDAPTPPCDRGFVKGEWRVGFGQTGQIMNGNTNVSVSYDLESETELCIEVPWGLIVQQAFRRISDAGDPEHLPFDLATAIANPPKFQVTALFNARLPFNGQDFTQPKLPADPPGFYLAVKDWMPDTARVADGEFNQYDPCAHNSAGAYGDQNVDANDVGAFLEEFGRSVFSMPCPTCKN
jgi:hypothetical protein